MIYYLTAIIMAMISLIFNSISALIIGLIVIFIGIFGEQ